jgi:hypothetical protein
MCALTGCRAFEMRILKLPGMSNVRIERPRTWEVHVERLPRISNVHIEDATHLERFGM